MITAIVGARRQAHSLAREQPAREGEKEERQQQLMMVKERIAIVKEQRKEKRRFMILAEEKEKASISLDMDEGEKRSSLMRLRRGPGAYHSVRSHLTSDYTGYFSGQDIGVVPIVTTRGSGITETALGQVFALLKHTEQGLSYWEFGPELDGLLGISSQRCVHMFNTAGLKSLGAKVAKQLLQLVATLLVLQLLMQHLPQLFPSCRSLLHLDVTQVSAEWRSAVQQVLTWAKGVDTMHPSVYSRLELGKSWDDLTKKLIGVAFEKEEEERIRAELSAYEQQLEEEARQERERTDKSIAALNRRKEDLLKEKKQKVKEEMERVAQQGVGEDEQRRLLEQHEKDVQKLEQKMEADRMRMQSGLQERLKRRREEKRRQKEAEVQNSAEEIRREHEEKLRSEEERMKKDEVLTLKESVNIDRLVPTQEDVSPAAVLTAQGKGPLAAQLPLPGSFQQTAPLQDGELTNILMASPLYQRLQEIKDLISNNSKLAAVGDGYLDSRDADWGADTEFQPVDLNKLSPKDFIVYKFACFIGSLLTLHCGHPPVTILLADSIPPNPQLSKNAYRNSFQYDHNNRILYVRRARMDRVGEFVLVLVHTLAHIKSGDLRDDSSPDFVQEFHRALSAVCNDLFFARYRRSSPGSVNENAASLPKVETMFGDCETESERDTAVEDLLDVKLLRGTSREGVHFSRGELNTRLSEYGSYTMVSQLGGLLGGVDDKMQSAKDHGSKDQIDSWLGQLQKDSLTGTSVLTRQASRGSSRSSSQLDTPSRAGLSGLALWKATAKDVIQEETPGGRMKVAIRKATEKDLLKQFLQLQVGELEEKVDRLSGEYSQLCRQAVELQTSMTELQEETARQTSLLQQAADSNARSQQMDLIKETVKKLNEARSNLTAANMTKASVAEKLETLQTQLDDKTVQLQSHLQKAAAKA